jgi:hypothetical protein
LTDFRPGRIRDHPPMHIWASMRRIIVTLSAALAAGGDFCSSARLNATPVTLLGQHLLGGWGLTTPQMVSRRRPPGEFRFSVRTADNWDYGSLKTVLAQLGSIIPADRPKSADSRPGSDLLAATYGNRAGPRISHQRDAMQSRPTSTPILATRRTRR